MSQLNPIPGTVAYVANKAAEERATRNTVVGTASAILLAGAVVGASAMHAEHELAENNAAHNRWMQSMNAQSAFGDVSRAGIGFAYQAADLCNLASKLPIHGTTSFTTNFQGSLKQLQDAAASFKVVYSGVGDATREQRQDHYNALTKLTNAWGNFSTSFNQIASFDEIRTFSFNGAFPTGDAYLACATGRLVQKVAIPEVQDALQKWRAVEPTPEFAIAK